MVIRTGVSWFVGAVIVACVVLLGSSTQGGDPAPAPTKPLPTESARAAVPNRVMTWNICNPCNKEGVRNEDRAADIAALAPQVVGMQEACVRDVEEIRDRLRSRHGLVYHVEYGSVLRNRGRCGGMPWSPGAFGQAILSAAPMKDRVNVEYPDGGSEDRGYLAVTTTVDGESVRVFNTHFAQRRQEAVRAKQAGVLAAEVARHDRAIVIGDFNAVPEAYELGRMWAVAKDADPRCRPSGDGACRVTTDWQSKYDYVFLRGVTPRKSQVRPSDNSDHHMFYADLTVG
ncbi:endonuclease/exonuclease/phosphatase family protein [Streptomyces sp. NPDC050504]|uniref:endonuclease/exonuclease/phosphatase family protein n=1 Tax=Streptomyces sp. NPDC050504 TaxID=3365618 RepID=UPI003793991A